MTKRDTLGHYILQLIEGHFPGAAPNCEKFHAITSSGAKEAETKRLQLVAPRQPRHCRIYDDLCRNRSKTLLRMVRLCCVTWLCHNFSKKNMWKLEHMETPGRRVLDVIARMRK